MDKLTTTFQLALQEAQSMAIGRDHQFIEPVHLMTAMLVPKNGAVSALYRQAGANVNELDKQCQQMMERLPRVSGTSGEVHISNSLNNLVNISDKLAQQHGDEYIASEMYAVAALEDKGELGKLLNQLGLSQKVLLTTLDKMRAGEK
ncbi:MAG: Clp protease N-terminal domain-containing protein, partial [Gammaproteobacteria bacterium]